MKYKLIRSTKGRIWVDDLFEVEADSLQEAKQKVLYDMVEPCGTETNWDTWDPMTARENDGMSTEKLYNEDELIYKNGE